MLGLNHRKYNPVMYGTGYGFAVVVPLLFAVIPLVMFFDARYQPRPATLSFSTHSKRPRAGREYAALGRLNTDYINLYHLHGYASLMLLDKTFLNLD